MKFVLIAALALCLFACSSSDNTQTNNQKPANNQNAVNVNKTMPNASIQPTVSNINTTDNSPNNMANSNEKASNLNEKITLKGGETGKVKGTELSLKAATVGAASLPQSSQNPQASASAIPYCRVEATLKGKTDGRQLYYNQPGRNEWSFEGYKIQLQNVTPTGNIDCTFVITKIEK